MTDTRRPIWVDVTLLILAAGMFVSMVALGNWQLHRLAWKLDLIEAVETRAFAEPVPAPIGAAPEYLHVTATGTFAHDKSLWIKAVTELGPGFWVMTPLQSQDGGIWVNRGFVPTGFSQDELPEPDGPVVISGLVRLDQPNGTLLERNKPIEGRWVSADLTEMSRAVGFDTAQALYFIDADANDYDGVGPRGGMTRLTFRNTHLSYALTWYAMAAMFLAAMVYVIRDRLTAE